MPVARTQPPNDAAAGDGAMDHWHNIRKLALEDAVPGKAADGAYGLRVSRTVWSMES